MKLPLRLNVKVLNLIDYLMTLNLVIKEIFVQIARYFKLYYLNRGVGEGTGVGGG